MSNRELEARIALLEYYSSLMQSYKTFILTFAVSFLTVLEIWFRIGQTELIPTPLGILLSFILGGILGSVFLCAWRWFWCGHIVTSAIRASSPPESPSLRVLEDQIKRYANDPEKCGDKKLQKLWMNLMHKGDDKILSLTASAFLSLSLGCLIFLYMAPLLHTCVSNESVILRLIVVVSLMPLIWVLVEPKTPQSEQNRLEISLLNP